MHPLIVEHLARERHQRLVEEASRARLLRRAGRPRTAGARLTVARLLIRTAHRLAPQPLGMVAERFNPGRQPVARPPQGPASRCSLMVS